MSDQDYICKRARTKESLDEGEKKLYNAVGLSAETMWCHHLDAATGKHIVLHGLPTEGHMKCQGVMYVGFGFKGKSITCGPMRPEGKGHDGCHKGVCPFMRDGLQCPYMQNAPKAKTKITEAENALENVSVVSTVDDDESSSSSTRQSSGLATPLVASSENVLLREDVKQQKPYPTWFRRLRKFLFRGWLLTTFIAFLIFVLVDLLVKGPQDPSFLQDLKYASIPVVSIFFTWWHVWLGLQMCFYPIEFKGCLKPVFGWQGIVPRRAGVMAERACEIMIGRLITFEEVIDRIKPDAFFDELAPVIAEANGNVLKNIGEKYWPSLWAMVPDVVKKEINQKALEESTKLIDPIIVDVKKNIYQIFDIKDMCVYQLTSNKALLVQLFQEIGSREFKFILHVSAFMGFVLGCVQLVLWACLSDSREYAIFILPASGLVIGYLTNWLAIFMIFKPRSKHVCCCGYLNFQGVFMKRQKQVAEELSKMLCSNMLKSDQMLDYIMHNNCLENGMTNLLEMHRKHTCDAVDNVMARVQFAIPVTIGREKYESLKADIVKEMLEVLPPYRERFTAYVDRVFDLEETLKTRLAALPPKEFEGMLHPVFQEDEWMILLLGGLLGVLVGFLQGLALGA